MAELNGKTSVQEIATIQRRAHAMAFNYFVHRLNTEQIDAHSTMVGVPQDEYSIPFNRAVDKYEYTPENQARIVDVAEKLIEDRRQVLIHDLKSWPDYVAIVETSHALFREAKLELLARTTEPKGSEFEEQKKQLRLQAASSRSMKAANTEEVRGPPGKVGSLTHWAEYLEMHALVANVIVRSIKASGDSERPTSGEYNVDMARSLAIVVSRFIAENLRGYLHDRGGLASFPIGDYEPSSIEIGTDEEDEEQQVAPLVKKRKKKKKRIVGSRNGFKNPHYIGFDESDLSPRERRQKYTLQPRSLAKTIQKAVTSDLPSRVGEYIRDSRVLGVVGAIVSVAVVVAIVKLRCSR